MNATLDDSPAMTTTTLADLRRSDAAHHLHPFTNHDAMLPAGTAIITGASGCHVFDAEGRRLLDGLAGLWCVNVGYNRPEIAEAISAQLAKLCYYPSFFNSTTEVTIELAEKLARLGPPRLTHTLFSGSGSEANETALKVIRNYWNLRGRPQKTKLLSRAHSYHGVTIATTCLTGLPSCTTPFNLPASGSGYVQIPAPYHYAANTGLSPEAHGRWCLDETEKIILREGPDTIAAVFIEPIQGAGGVIVPPPGYLAGIREIARRHDILFVADEVISGFGRLGAWFASLLWDLDPDIMTTAKGITSGYIPLGATRVSSEIADALLHGGYFAHGHTYSGHPVACAAALANIALIEKEKLVERTRDDAGPYFQQKLRALAAHPAVGEARGVQLIGALELLPPGGKAALTPALGLGAKAAAAIRARGAIVRGIGNLIALSPPLTITHAEIDELFDAVEQGLDSGFAG